MRPDDPPTAPPELDALDAYSRVVTSMAEHLTPRVASSPTRSTAASRSPCGAAARSSTSSPGPWN